MGPRSHGAGGNRKDEPAFRRRRPLIRPGTPPGSLPEPAEGVEPPPIVVTAIGADGVREHTERTVEAAVAHVRPGDLVWLSVDGLDARVLAPLGRRFNVHPLAIEDALSVPQRLKAERYEDLFFLALRTIHSDPYLREEQVSIFFGPGWVLSVQEHPGQDLFAPVRETIRQARGRVLEAGADYLAYLLLDAVVDGFFPAIEAVTGRLEACEDEALGRPRPATLARIQLVRRDLLTLRRSIWPLREEVGLLQRDESGLISPATRVYLRDVYDHAVQALELVESLRESIASVMEIHLAGQNQRLNEVMKVLTVIATVFIPLTFIASIYGMNFQVMPELSWRYGYAWALGLMVVIAAAMATYFRRRGWW
jgi:magnesium transporter